MRRKHRRDGFVLAFAVGLIGVTYGVFANTAGIGFLQTVVLSALTFTGASQFAYVSVIDGGGNPVAAMGTALLLSARNALYGPMVEPVLRKDPVPRAVIAHFVIDETTAMATSCEEVQDGRDAFWFTGVWLFIFWNIGTVLGVLTGEALENPGAWGLDAAFPAAFVALLVPHVRDTASRITALTGAVIALIAIPTTPSGFPLLLAALAVGPGLLIRIYRGGEE